MKRYPLTFLCFIASLMLGANNNAYAESATDRVDAKVGLQPALALECSDISFGVWRIPARNATQTKLSLDFLKGEILASGNVSKIAHSIANLSWLHQRGICILTGSNAVRGSNVAVQLSQNTAMEFDSANYVTTGFEGIRAATTAVPGMQATLNAPSNVKIGFNGTAIFFVGGEITIPGKITAENHGGYRAKRPVIVSIDDGV